MVTPAPPPPPTRVMVRSRPMVSPRRAGAISPGGRLDDPFMVGPRGHATGRPPPVRPGLTGNGRVWKGTAVVGQPPQSPNWANGRPSGTRAELALVGLLHW